MDGALVVPQKRDKRDEESLCLLSSPKTKHEFLCLALNFLANLVVLKKNLTMQFVKFIKLSLWSINFVFLVCVVTLLSDVNGASEEGKRYEDNYLLYLYFGSIGKWKSINLIGTKITASSSFVQSRICRTQIAIAHNLVYLYAPADLRPVCVLSAAQFSLLLSIRPVRTGRDARQYR